MSNAQITCPACGRENRATARTCANCATVLTPPSAPTDEMPTGSWQRLAAQEAVYGSEFGTVQGGAWEKVSTERKSGEMPLPPQVQAEALRRQREEAQAKAVAARAARERVESERRAQDDAARRAADAVRAAAVTRTCPTCGVPVVLQNGESAFSFCVNCGNSFASLQTVRMPQGTVPPVIAAAYRPHPEQAQSLARPVFQPAYRTQVRVAERADILPVTEATPYVAAILSFLLPGTGQLRNAQWSKGLLLLVATFTLLALLPVGLWSVTALILRSLVALDAFRIAERRRRGQPVTPWQWDAGLIAER